MSRLRIASIVEGHGEVLAIPILLERIWYEILQGDYIHVIRPPIRQPRDRLAQNKEGALTRAVQLAAAKLDNEGDSNDPALILVIVDADEDCAAKLGPRLLTIARDSRRDKEIACVVAVVEFETWFVACAESLSKFLKVDQADDVSNPEGNRQGKGWVERKFRGVKYSETVDQAKLTANMDLRMCRKRSSSFDKLCRELERAFNRGTKTKPME